MSEWQLLAQIEQIDRVRILNAEAYEPPVAAALPTQPTITTTSSARPNQPDPPLAVQSRRRPYRSCLLVYATFNQVLASSSASWADSRAGAGLVKGMGGGVSYQWLLTRRLAIGFTADYAQWLVERRFFEQSVQQFSSDQVLRRGALLLKIRMYTRGNFYLQPMGG